MPPYPRSLSFTTKGKIGDTIYTSNQSPLYDTPYRGGSPPEPPDPDDWEHALRFLNNRWHAMTTAQRQLWHGYPSTGCGAYQCGGPYRRLPDFQTFMSFNMHRWLAGKSYLAAPP